MDLNMTAKAASTTTTVITLRPLADPSPLIVSIPSSRARPCYAARIGHTLQSFVSDYQHALSN